jgi:hypothetical protein
VNHMETMRQTDIRFRIRCRKKYAARCREFGKVCRRKVCVLEWEGKHTGSNRWVFAVCRSNCVKRVEVLLRIARFRVDG